MVFNFVIMMRFGFVKPGWMLNVSKTFPCSTVLVPHIHFSDSLPLLCKVYLYVTICYDEIVIIRCPY